MKLSHATTILLALFAIATPVSAQTALTPADSADLTITLLRRAMLNVGAAHAYGLREVVCVGFGAPDPAPQFITLLQDSTPLLVRPVSACRQDPLSSGPRSGPLVYDTLTGKRGIHVNTTFPVIGADGSFTIAMSYYEHGLSSAKWTCFGRKRDQGGWEISSCRLDRIS